MNKSPPPPPPFTCGWPPPRWWECSPWPNVSGRVPQLALAGRNPSRPVVQATPVVAKAAIVPKQELLW